MQLVENDKLIISVRRPVMCGYCCTVYRCMCSSYTAELSSVLSINQRRVSFAFFSKYFFAFFLSFYLFHKVGKHVSHEYYLSATESCWKWTSCGSSVCLFLYVCIQSGPQKTVPYIILFKMLLHLFIRTKRHTI